MSIRVEMLRGWGTYGSEGQRRDLGCTYQFGSHPHIDSI